MGKGVYEWTWSAGDDRGRKARFVRETNGHIRYWVNEDKWSFLIEPSTWAGIVAAMGEEALANKALDELRFDYGCAGER